MLTIKPPVGYASIALGVAALHAVLWFTIQSPPCQDVPFHVAAAELIARSRSAPLEFFTVNTLFWRPNTGFEQVASRFPALPPSAWIVVYLLAVVSTASATARRARGSPVLAACTLLSVYNLNFSVGLVGFCLGIAAVLWTAFLLDTPAVRPRWPHALGVTLLTIAAFYIHVFAAVVCLSMVVLWVALHDDRRHKWPLLVGLLPALFLILLWIRLDPGEQSRQDLAYLWRYYDHDYVRTFPRRLALLAVVDQRHWTASVPGQVGIALVALSVQTWAGWHIFRAAPETRRERLRSPWAILFLVAATAALVLPPDMVSHYFLYQRFASIATLALIVLAASMPSKASPTGRSSLVRVLIPTLLLAHFVLVVDYARAFDRSARSGRELLRTAAQQGGRIAGLLNGVDFRGRELYRHFQDYYVLAGGEGIVSGLSDFRLQILEKAVPDSVLPTRQPFGPNLHYRGQYDQVEHILYIDLPDGCGFDDLLAGRDLEHDGRWTLASRRR